MMKIEFPAMRGIIGGREYYSTLMPLSTIPKLFTFTDWEELSPEDREQRKLTTSRIPDIARYMVDNEDGYLFNSITASYKGELEFVPIGEDENIGVMRMDMSQATFVINDGQHRAAGIKLAIQLNPALGHERISVLLFDYESRDRVQQMFTDLNAHSKKTSKSLNILYDKRDTMATVAGTVADVVPAFSGQVDKEYISLPAGSKNLFTLAALYDATDELLRDRKEDATRNELIALAVEFWTKVSEHIPDWMRVKQRAILARELRQQGISSHAVVLRAIGGAGAELLKHHSDNWQERLSALETVDWSKSNKDWEGVNIVANSVVSNRQARVATKAYIKQKLGLELSEAEARSITPAVPQAA